MKVKTNRKGAILYHNIPKNHILKLINSAISLNFVNNALKDSYYSNFGQAAKEPEIMVRILIIKHLSRRRNGFAVWLIRTERTVQDQ